jgi:hypothetical protein
MYRSQQGFQHDQGRYDGGATTASPNPRGTKRSLEDSATSRRTRVRPDRRSTFRCRRRFSPIPCRPGAGQLRVARRRWSKDKPPAGEPCTRVQGHSLSAAEPTQAIARRRSVVTPRVTPCRSNLGQANFNSIAISSLLAIENTSLTTRVAYCCYSTLVCEYTTCMLGGSDTTPTSPEAPNHGGSGGLCCVGALHPAAAALANADDSADPSPGDLAQTCPDPESAVDHSL